MESLTVEERLAVMERRMDTMQRLLEERLPQTESKKERGWQSIVGTFANDPLYEEAMRLGREWRESQHDQDDTSVEKP